ncbi:MAG: Fur family transcriptional regulator [Dictyoglomaceae bacterium]
MELRKTFKDFGLRMSKQRVAVLEFFEENKTGHYSLNEIYENISQKNKNISFTSVYRTCKLLEKLGLIRAISFEERHIHYESNLNPHLHYQCLICGKIVEEDAEWVNQWRGKLEKKDFLITSYRIQIYGICKDCQKKYPEVTENGKNLISNE